MKTMKKLVQDMISKNDTYKIIRFDQNAPNKIVRRGLSLDEAQAHCSRADTRCEGKWFDGYTKE